MLWPFTLQNDCEHLKINEMSAYLGYTLRMRTLFRGWPIMFKDTHTRRRRINEMIVITIVMIVWMFCSCGVVKNKWWQWRIFCSCGDVESMKTRGWRRWISDWNKRMTTWLMSWSTARFTYEMISIVLVSCILCTLCHFRCLWNSNAAVISTFVIIVIFSSNNNLI